MISSLVFPVHINVCKNLWFYVMTHFWRNKHCTNYLLHSFILTVKLRKIYRFFHLKLYLSSYADRLTKSKKSFGAFNFFWKVLVAHMIQNNSEKRALLWAFQLHFNCEIYPIAQFLSLKLPMTSYVYTLLEKTFGIKIADSEKLSHKSHKSYKKQKQSIINPSVLI